MDSLILKAREFAREAHKAQARSYTGAPYFEHLEEVATIVENARLSKEAIAAAWLHDVIEDQGVSLKTLADNFGDTVTLMVIALTDTPVRPGFNREKRKEIDRGRLADASPDVQSIKCADLISNTSSIVKHDHDFAKLYLVEKRATLDVLTRAKPGLLYYAKKSLENAENELLQRALAP